MRNSNREGKLILFVEDEEDEQELMTFTLTGYEIVIARDFTEGLRLARQRDFDLYILDNWLPDRAGIELCQCIREFDPHTPILFYSAAAYEGDVQEGLRAGAQIYMTKPSNPNELRRAVARLTAGANDENHLRALGRNRHEGRPSFDS